MAEVDETPVGKDDRKKGPGMNTMLTHFERLQSEGDAADTIKMQKMLDHIAAKDKSLAEERQAINRRLVTLVSGVVIAVLLLTLIGSFAAIGVKLSYQGVGVQIEKSGP